MNMFKNDEMYIGYIILAGSICVGSVFGLWLYKDTDLEMYIDYISKFRRLHLYERYTEASALRSETLAGMTGDTLAQVWLPVVQEEPDVARRLDLYSRILAANPERESSYEEIAEIINTSVEEFTMKEKRHYLKKLRAIKGINYSFLDAYGLLMNDDR